MAGNNPIDLSSLSNEDLLRMREEASAPPVTDLSGVSTEELLKLQRDAQQEPQFQRHVPQWGQEHPELYGMAGAARDVLAPALEMTGLVGGGIVGTGAGGGVASPVTGVAGAATGYAAAKELTKFMDIKLGNRPDDESFLDTAKETGSNAVTGAELEMGGQSIVPAAKMAWNYTGKPVIEAGKRVLGPWLEGGIEKVVGKQLLTAAGDKKKAIIELLRENKTTVKGSQGTAAEVASPAGSAEFSGLERAVKGYKPSQYNEIEQAQNAVRVAALRSIGKDKEALNLAKQLRRKVTGPLYKEVEKSTALADPTRTVNLIDKIISKNPARTQIVSTLKQIREGMFESFPIAQRAATSIKDISNTLAKRMSSADSEALRQIRLLLNRVKSDRIGVEEAIAGINKIKTSSQTASSSKQFAVDNLKTPEFVLRDSPEALQSASKNIGDLLAAKDAVGKPINQAIRRELTTIKKSIDNQIRKAVPEYGQAQATFTELSKPIDQMKVGQHLEKQLSKARTDYGGQSKQSADALAKALREESGTIKKATGFRREEMADVLTPKQLSTAEGVVTDLTRQGNNEALASKGLAQAMRQLGDISAIKLPNALHRPIMIINGVLNRVMGKVEGRSLERLSEIMQNPSLTLKIMEEASAAELKSINAFINKAAEFNSAGRVGGAVASQYTQ